jgi:ATP-dependent RNA helicase RhlB
MPLLLGILKREQPESLIIFCNTKKQTEIVAKRLKMNGFSCEFIIGDLPQVKRLKVINDVKAGKTKILAATDVAARGLDIESLSMVINYDVPCEAENYVHRIGRTARAGKTGKAITFSSEQDVYELPAIERYIGKKIPSEIAMLEHYEKDKTANMRIQTERYEDKSFPRKKEEKKLPRKEKRIQKPKRENKNVNTQNLSNLSMEERMVLYRKKYAGSSIEHQNKHQNAKPEKLEKPEQIEQKKPAKKGVLSWLTGIFKK